MDSRARVGEAIVGQSVVGYVVQSESSANVHVVGNVDLTYHILVYVSSLFSVVGQAVVDAVYTNKYMLLAPNKLNVNTFIISPQFSVIANPNSQNVVINSKQPLSITRISDYRARVGEAIVGQSVVGYVVQTESSANVSVVGNVDFTYHILVYVSSLFSVVGQVVVDAVYTNNYIFVAPNKLNVNTLIVFPKLGVIANPNTQNVATSVKQPLSVTQIWNVYPRTFSLDMSLGASQFIYAISPLISHMSTYTKSNYARYAKLLFFKNSKLTNGVDRNAF